MSRRALRALFLASADLHRAGGWAGREAFEMRSTRMGDVSLALARRLLRQKRVKAVRVGLLEGGSVRRGRGEGGEVRGVGTSGEGRRSQKGSVRRRGQREESRQAQGGPTCSCRSWTEAVGRIGVDEDRQRRGAGREGASGRREGANDRSALVRPLSARGARPGALSESEKERRRTRRRRGCCGALPRSCWQTWLGQGRDAGCRSCWRDGRRARDGTGRAPADVVAPVQPGRSPARRPPANPLQTALVAREVEHTLSVYSRCQARRPFSPSTARRPCTALAASPTNASSSLRASLPPARPTSTSMRFPPGRPSSTRPARRFPRPLAPPTPFGCAMHQRATCRADLDQALPDLPQQPRLPSPSSFPPTRCRRLAYAFLGLVRPTCPNLSAAGLRQHPDARRQPRPSSAAPQPPRRPSSCRGASPCPVSPLARLGVLADRSAPRLSSSVRLGIP